MNRVLKVADYWCGEETRRRIFEPLLADLESEFRANRSLLTRARWWFAIASTFMACILGGEMTTVLSSRSLSLAMALGAYGGAALSLSHLFFTPGKYILMTYSLVVVGLTVAIRAESVQSFTERFLAALIAFMVASVTLAVTIMVQTSTVPNYRHAGLLLFLLVAGVGISVPAGILARAPHGRQST